MDKDIFAWKVKSFIVTKKISMLYFSIYVVVPSLSRVWPFVNPQTAACQASLSFIISQS